MQGLQVEPLVLTCERYQVTFDELLNANIKALTPRTQKRLERYGMPAYLKDFISTRRTYLGYIYLIHFDVPYKHAKHYLGFTRNVNVRMDRHIARNGANLMRVIEEAGITWKITRIWVGDRYVERRLKKTHNSPRYCPICSAEEGTNGLKSSYSL